MKRYDDKPARFVDKETLQRLYGYKYDVSRPTIITRPITFEPKGSKHPIFHDIEATGGVPVLVEVIHHKLTESFCFITSQNAPAANNSNRLSIRRAASFASRSAHMCSYIPTLNSYQIKSEPSKNVLENSVAAFTNTSKSSIKRYNEATESLLLLNKSSYYYSKSAKEMKEIRSKSEYDYLLPEVQNLVSHFYR